MAGLRRKPSGVTTLFAIMPATTYFQGLFQRSRKLPVVVRYGLTALIVGATSLLRLWAEPLLPPSTWLCHFLVAVLVCSALFDRGSGLLAIGLSVLVGVWLHLPPVGSFAVKDPRDIVALFVFVAIALAIATVIETLHKSVERLQRTIAELETTHGRLDRAERARGLMLREFRHRTRNDLAALFGLLTLRARMAPSETAREALREAADHAMALSRVHTQLATENGPNAGTGVGDREHRRPHPRSLRRSRSRAVRRGMAGGAAGGCGVAHPAERTRGAARPDVERGGCECPALRLSRQPRGAGAGALRARGEEFVLTVSDDGIGLLPEEELSVGSAVRRPVGPGLGSRVMAALAAQLRGTFTRQAGPEGVGTVAELRFPVALR